MKAEGTTAGVSDLILLFPSKRYHGLCIEMKWEKGKQQPSQKKWQRAVEEAGFKYVIARSFDQFMDEINTYLR